MLEKRVSKLSAILLGVGAVGALLTLLPVLFSEGDQASGWLLGGAPGIGLYVIAFAPFLRTLLVFSHHLRVAPPARVRWELIPPILTCVILLVLGLRFFASL